MEIKIQNCVNVEFSTNDNQDNNTSKQHELAPLITHENSLAKNTWITKSTIVLKQMITTNKRSKTYKMHAINKKQMDQMPPSSSHGKPFLQTMWTTKSTMMTSQIFLSVPCHVKITKCHKIWHYTHLMKSHAQMM